MKFEKKRLKGTSSCILVRKKFGHCLELPALPFRFVASFVDAEWFMKVVTAAFYLEQCFCSCGLPTADSLSLKAASSPEWIVARKEWIDFLVDGSLRLIDLA